MTRLKKYKWALLILALHLAGVLWFAARLPADARVPIHWNFQNQVDGWTSRGTGLIWGIGLNVVLFLLLYLLHWYSPWYKKYAERFEKILPPLTTTLLASFSALSLYSLYVAKWGEVPGVNMVLILIGLLFLFLGNLLPKVPKNFFVGIRTPWTIASDAVWEKTHRLGGLLFVLAGLIMILKGFVLPQNPGFQNITTVLALGCLLYPALHSFILYKKKAR
ncbi:MAG: SdpI family protein [Candidatus Cloacimonetes bacterium]|nr:SdpI family protein [Candidatus Cloacimonadota bacterium]MDD4224116.1 SdpI family protein [Candidatus Cloacimonadota bacterium]